MANTLIHRGSVKNIFQDEENYKFVFSDRYSIFDWGEMPDSIPHKGRALSYIAEVFFRELTKIKIKHHFIKSDHDAIIVKKFNVHRPKWFNDKYDYSSYVEKKVENTLIPLEVIFRFDLHPESSLKDRLGKDPLLHKQWGLSPGDEKFSDLIIDFSTKFEKSDRYLTFEEAQKISGMSHREFIDLMDKTKIIALKIHEITSSLGIKLWDGKLEFAFGDIVNQERELILVDSIGLDELRLEFNGLSLSKEFLREFYRQSDWYYHLTLLKKEQKGLLIDFQKSCVLKPQKLPQDIITIISAIYQSFANELAIKYDQPLPFDKDMNLLKLKSFYEKNRDKKNKVIILGKGARESALALKLSYSDKVHSVIVIPGNPMMSSLHSKISTNEIMDFNLIRLMNPDLIVIGPEDLLELGVVDYFQQYGIPVVGPTREAANLELSKLFCKKIFSHADILTARFKTASNFDEAVECISSWNISQQFVLKVDEICQGKGVIICKDKAEGLKIAKSLFDGSYLGKNVKKILIEECLYGVELSVFAITDGESFKFLGSATDYKRLEDGDHGPNTGGMGAIAPSPILDQNDVKILNEKYFPNIISEMKKEGLTYKGFIFLGLLKNNHGLYALEVNARLGDPETQVLLPLIENDLFDYCLSSVKGNLHTLSDITFRNLSAAHVVMTAKGYPGIDGEKVQLGEEIKFKKVTSASYFYPASISFNRDKNAYFSNGGRVLGVTGISRDLKDAVDLCYQNIQRIQFNDAYYRKDIGRKFI